MLPLLTMVPSGACSEAPAPSSGDRRRRRLGDWPVSCRARWGLEREAREREGETGEIERRKKVTRWFPWLCAHEMDWPMEGGSSCRGWDGSKHDCTSKDLVYRGGISPTGRVVLLEFVPM